jgi:Rrf2 family protein
MRISKKGLYALQAMMRLAKDYHHPPVTIHTIAVSEGIPEKFLELILHHLKSARLLESVRGARGGYGLKRSPSKIFLGEIIRTIDGPLAPLADAAGLRRLVKQDRQHSALYRVFLDVRNAAARILDHTSLADLAQGRRARVLERRNR